MVCVCCCMNIGSGTMAEYIVSATIGAIIAACIAIALAVIYNWITWKLCRHQIRKMLERKTQDWLNEWEEWNNG